MILVFVQMDQARNICFLRNVSIQLQIQITFNETLNFYLIKTERLSTCIRSEGFERGVTLMVIF